MKYSQRKSTLKALVAGTQRPIVIKTFRKETIGEGEPEIEEAP